MIDINKITNIVSKVTRRENNIYRHLSKYPNLPVPQFIQGTKNWIKIEYIRGMPLSQWIDNNPDKIEEILDKVQTALVELCSANLLLHGDLHSGNVVVDNDGNVKIIDFENAVLGKNSYVLYDFFSLVASLIASDIGISDGETIERLKHNPCEIFDIEKLTGPHINSILPEFRRICSAINHNFPRDFKCKLKDSKIHSPYAPTIYSYITRKIILDH
jgi:hypothetical protein